MSKVIILAFAQIAVVSSTFALTADAASKPEIAIEISQQIQQSDNAKQLLQQGLKFYQTEEFPHLCKFYNRQQKPLKVRAMF